MGKLKDVFVSDWKNILKHYGFIVLGSMFLAIGTGIFLLPAVLNTGGMMGLGIIANRLFGFDADIVVLVLTWAFFLISLLFLGWRFTLKSLVSSLVYPLMLILLMRLPAIASQTKILFGDTTDVATKLIAGIFGGVFCGVGVALTFLGGGSTGGVDIIVVIINKYTRISHSVLAFVIDGLIVALGLFILQDVILSLIGIISAFVYAVTLEFVFAGKSHSLTAQIISPTKSAEINEYIQTKTNRGSTLIPVKGGYEGDEYTMISVTFDRSEYAKIINGVAKIDKDAFVTIKQTATVLGEGFNSLVPPKEGLVNRNKKDE
ncbi:MAG: YitT family protein [Bacilli bacterium]